MNWEQDDVSFTSEQPGGLTRGLWPVLKALLIASPVALTLFVSVVLGAQEQALVLEPRPTVAATDAPRPTSTLAPLAPVKTYALLPTDPPFQPTAVPPRSTSTKSLLPTVLPTFEPTATPTPTKKPTKAPPLPRTASCSKPKKWVNYKIQRGDTLSSLAIRYGVTVQKLKTTNCLRSNTIYAGATLWVPFQYSPTATRRPTKTKAPTQSPTATQTRMTVTPTTTGSTAAPPATDTGTPGSPTATTGPTGTTTPPTATTEPTETPVPPTDADPPTNTPAPPTDTPVPPTKTPVPPTKTPVPPTDTPVPPTDTPVPPTATETT